MPWTQLEAAMARLLAQTTTSAMGVPTVYLFGAAPVVAGGGSPAGRPRLPVGLMLSLLYLVVPEEPRKRIRHSVRAL